MHKRNRLLALILTTVTLLVAACSPNPGISIPAAPTGLTLAPGEGKIVLSWQDNSSNEIGFAIYRKEIALGAQQNQGGEFEQIDTVPADTTTYEDTTVEVDGLYQYGVSAVGEGGTSEVSAPQDDTPVQPVNLAPEADAQTVTASEDSFVAFTLTGSDPEETPLEFTVASQPEHGTLSGTAPNLTYTPDPDFNGSDSFEFTVSDGANDSAAATVTLTVDPVNDEPVVEDSILTTSEDTPVDVLMSASDVDGDTLSYEIVSAPSHGTLSGTGSTRTYTPDADFTGSDSFRFRVNDGTVDSSVATVILDVKAAGDPPLADPQSVTTDEDTPVSIVLSGSDPDGDPLTFTLVGSPDHGSLSGTAPNLLYLPDPDYNGSDSFEFTVSDGGADSAPAAVSITVNPVADAPEFTSTPVTGAVQDTLYNYDVAASDADLGDTLTITAVTKPAWLTLTDNGGGSATLSGTPTNAQVGDHDVELLVTDLAGATDTQSFTITVSNDNDAPAFTSTPVTDATEDTAYSYAVETSDIDAGDTHRITPAAALPGWLSLTDLGDGTATLSGTPSNDDVGDHDVSLRVTDAAGAAATQSFTITVGNGNDAPEFTSTPITGAAQDSAYSYDVAAGDDDVGDTLAITAVTKPAWLTLTDNGGGSATLSGTPTNAQVGDHDVELLVTDLAGATDTQSFTITVSNDNDAPAFTSTPVTDATEDTAYSYAVETSDIDAGDTHRITPAAALPGWLSLTDLGDGTATLSGTPSNDDVGDHDVSLRVTDAAGAAATQSYTVTVGNTNDAPTVTTAIADQNTDEDSAFSFDISSNFSDVDVGDTLTFSATGQPASLTMSAAGTLSGTPTNDDVGSYTVTVTADDSNGGTVSGEFGLVVANTNDAPTLDAAIADQSGDEDSAFSLDVSGNFSDVDVGDALTFTATGQPASLTMSAAGTLSGTPTNDDVGSYTVTVTADDSNGGTATDDFELVISNTNDAPSFTSTPITGAVQDSAYSYDVAASDDDVGDTLAITAVTKPAWLTLTDNGGGSATLSGTPTNAQVGDHDVELLVTDLAGETDTQSFTVTVSNTNDAPEFTSTPVTAATEDSAYSYDVETSDADSGDTLRITPAAALPGWLSLTDFGDGTASLGGTPGNDDVGDHAVSLRVTDAAGAAATQSYTVTVSNTNDAPTLDAAIADQNTDEDAPFSLDVSGNFSDIDVGDTLTFTATGQPASLTMSAAGTLSGTPTNDDVGTYTVTVTADDSNGGTATDEFELEIVNTNDAPTLDAAIADQSGDEDSAFSLDVSGNFSDVDVGDTLTFSATGQPASLTMSAAGTLSGTPTNDDVGTYTVTVTADDSNGGTVGDEFELVISNTNDAPSFTSTPVTGAVQDSLYNYDVAAGDDDAGDTLAITAVTKPAWLTLTDNGGGSATLSGTPTNAQVGDHDVELLVTDLAGETDTQSFTVTVSNSNDAPSFTSTPVTSATEDSAYSYDVETSDPDVGDTFTITGETLPSWLALADNGDGTATLSGTPTNDDVGPHTVELRVTDAAGAAATQSFTVTVANTNDAPVADDVSVSAAEDGPAVTGAFAGSDVDDGDSLTYAITSTPAEGSAGNNNDGTFSFDPDSDFQDLAQGETRDVSFDYTATDTQATTSNTATVTVTVTGVNDAPVITEGDTISPGIGEDQVLNIVLNATDVDGDILSWSISSPATNGTALASGSGNSQTVVYTPDPSYSGTDSFDVQVSDGNGGSDTITVDVSISDANDAPFFVSDPVTGVDEDTLYSYDIVTGDSDAGDTLEINEIVLPAWLTLTDIGDGTGTLTGTPTNDEVGDHPVSLVVSDAAGTAALQTFTVTVANTNDSPVISEGDGPLAVTMDEDGSPTAFSLSLNATDVDVGDVLSWSISSDPTNGNASVDGDGNVSYTPDADYNGGDSFEVQVSDGYAGPVEGPNQAPTDTVTVNVTINPIEDSPVAIDDAFEVDEDGTLNGNVITEVDLGGDADSDPDGDTVTVVDVDPFTAGVIDPVSGPSNGTLSLAADGSFTYTPGLDFNGTDSFTYRITDDPFDTRTDDATVTITVNPLNDAPSFKLPADPDQSVDEDAGAQTVNTFATDFNPGGGADESGQLITDYLVTNDNNALFSAQPDIDNDGNLTYTPADNANGSATVSVKVLDTGGTANPGDDNSSDPALTFTITVNALNDAPSFKLPADPDQSVDEDAGAQTVNTFATDFNPGGGTDESGQTISDYLVTNDNNALFSTQPDIDNLGNLTYTPADDANGSATVSVQVRDSGTANTGEVDTSSPALTFTITVNPINDEPSFSLIVTPNQTVAEDAGAQTVNTFATDFNPGGGTDEATQVISDFIVTNDNNALFSAQPDIDNDGNLTYTPADDANGSATVSVQVQDDGGTANPGDVDTSDPALTFTITVNALNDAPSFKLPADPDQSVDEDAGAQTVNTFATDFNPGGGTDESGQTISDYLVTNDNNALFSTQPDIDNLGNLTYTPADDANGSATVSVQVRDSGTANTGEVDTSSPALTFTITVNPINDEPSFSLIVTPNQTVAEDAGAQTVNTFATDFNPGGGTDEATQVISDFIVTNDNNALFSAQPDIDNDGNLTYTPADDANGSATVSVQVQDDGGTANPGDVDTSDPALTFTITVNPINDPPTANDDTGTTDKSALLFLVDPAGAETSLFANDSDTEDDLLSLVSFDATSTMGASINVLPDGRFSYDPRFAPALQALQPCETAEDTFTYTIQDPSTAQDTATVTITVTSAGNCLPSFTSTPVTEATEGESYTYNVTADDEDGTATLSITATTKPAWLTLTDLGNGAATLSGTPGAGDVGGNAVTLEVADGAGGTDTQSFTITVAAASSAPTPDFVAVFSGGWSSNSGDTTGAADDLGNPSGDHVYEVTIPAGATNLEVLTCLGFAPDFDTVLRLLDNTGTEVAFNDNDDLNVWCGAPFSYITFPVTGGQVYYVVVEGVGAEEGLYDLFLSAP